MQYCKPINFHVESPHRFLWYIKDKNINRDKGIECYSFKTAGWNPGFSLLDKIPNLSNLLNVK